MYLATKTEVENGLAGLYVIGTLFVFGGFAVMAGLYYLGTHAFL